MQQHHQEQGKWKRCLFNYDNQKEVVCLGGKRRIENIVKRGRMREWESFYLPSGTIGPASSFYCPRELIVLLPLFHKTVYGLLVFATTTTTTTTTTYKQAGPVSIVKWSIKEAPFQMVSAVLFEAVLFDVTSSFDNYLADVNGDRLVSFN